MDTLHKLEFGFYPNELEITQGPISISTLPGLAKRRDDIEQDPNLRKNWIYPGNAETQLLGVGIRSEPYSVRVFGMPKTHSIEHASAVDETQVKFYVWALSFFTGMRLTTEEAGFLDNTPIKPGMLIDFHIRGQIAPALELADRFWTDHKANRRQADRLCAAIHALFMAQNPKFLEFECFIYIYTALDACFATLHHATSGQKPNHAERLKWMCDRLNIPVPAWASTGPSRSTEVSALRNDAMHEALFVGEPLGFGIGGVGGDRNLTLEMQNLTCRILAATLGVSDMAYLGAPLDDRQKREMRLA